MPIINVTQQEPSRRPRPRRHGHAVRSVTMPFKSSTYYVRLTLNSIVVICARKDIFWSNLSIQFRYKRIPGLATMMHYFRLKKQIESIDLEL